MQDSYSLLARLLLGKRTKKPLKIHFRCCKAFPTPALKIKGKVQMMSKEGVGIVLCFLFSNNQNSTAFIKGNKNLQHWFFPKHEVLVRERLDVSLGITGDNPQVIPGQQYQTYTPEVPVYMLETQEVLEMKQIHQKMWFLSSL